MCKRTYPNSQNYINVSVLSECVKLVKGIPSYFFQKNFSLVKRYIMILETKNCIISMFII